MIRLTPQYVRMVAQTGRVLDLWHRPDNVHYSNGAQAFIGACIEALREALPWVRIEVRTDGAFFSDEMVSMLDGLKVNFIMAEAAKKVISLSSDPDARWTIFRSDDSTAINFI